MEQTGGLPMTKECYEAIMGKLRDMHVNQANTQATDIDDNDEIDPLPLREKMKATEEVMTELPDPLVDGKGRCNF